MDAVPQYRQFVYALLATTVAFAVWRTWFGTKDGIWIMIGALALFAALAFLDGGVVGRIRQRRESSRQGSGDRRERGDGDPGA